MKAITIWLGAMAMAALLAGCGGGTEAGGETAVPETAVSKTAAAPTSPSTQAAPPAGTQPAIPAAQPPQQAPQGRYAWVSMETSMGEIVLRLDRERAPITVENFLSYVEEGFYDGTIFHRVLENFVIQGGGFAPGMAKKPTKAAITNEWRNGLKNLRGTISMARTRQPDSATSQFFISVQDNPALDQANPATGGAGYAVFGEVVAGMEAVDRIRRVPTANKPGFEGLPVEDVLLKRASELAAEEARKRIAAAGG